MQLQVFYYYREKRSSKSTIINYWKRKSDVLHHHTSFYAKKFVFISDKNVEAQRVYELLYINTLNIQTELHHTELGKIYRVMSGRCQLEVPLEILM